MEKNTDSFFKNTNYQKLKNKLDWDNSHLLIDVVKDAIQYGIDIMADNLQSERGEKMSKYQVGDEVAVDFIGKVKKIELCFDGKIKYTVETERELCMVLESAVLPLPKSEGDFKEVKE